MDPQTIIIAALLLSIVLFVVSLGLHADLQEILYLPRRPAQLARAMGSMYVVMPVVAVALALWLPLLPTIKVALLCLSVSPIPPLLPKRATKAGGDEGEALSLLVAAAFASIVVTPLGVYLIGRIFGQETQIPPLKVAATVAMTILAPLAAGLLIHRFAPRLADRLRKPVAASSTILLVAAALPVLIKLGPSMLALVGQGTLIAMLAFSLVGLVAGHLLGGPRIEDRASLAVMTAARHPGVAVAIATINMPDPNPIAAAILLYLLICGVLGFGYVAYLRKAHARPAPAV